MARAGLAADVSVQSDDESHGPRLRFIVAARAVEPAAIAAQLSRLMSAFALHYRIEHGKPAAPQDASARISR